MDHNPTYPIISYDSFNYDPLSFDEDDLHQLVNSIIPPTPQNVDVTTFFSESNLQSQDHTLLLPNISISTHASQQHQAITTPHEQDNNVDVAAPSKGKGKKKSNAKDIERQRRQEMASLYHDLRSILPEEYVKGRRSKSDLVQEAINYINNLELGIEELNEKKDKLSRTMMKKRSRLSAASRSSSSSNNTTTIITQHKSNNVTVNPCKDGIIEVIVNTNATYDNDDVDDDENSSQSSLLLSKVLHILNGEGLHVINCVSSRIDDNMVHTIQAQIDDGREIDLGLLQQTLTHHY